MSPLGLFVLGAAVAAIAAVVFVVLLRQAKRKQVSLEVEAIRNEERNRVEKQSDDEAWEEFLKHRSASSDKSAPTN